ncbi:Tfp pilus assembly protein FimT/FimU, partial [Bacteriovorax sp. DB6_IX]|uniref:pilus assembly FimT family protein n=1 Tax=Bacteriovorax sp. DB6_IX TaxID=1353530 RepID=UPI00038A0275
MTFKNKGLSEAGFTLLEILVALALVSVILMMVAGSSYSSRKNLDELMANIERTIRFSTDEAAMKNQFVRLSVSLDGEEQKISLEYSDDPNLVIDTSPKEENDSDDEDANKKKNDNFTPVSDFSSDEFNIPVGVKIVGVGTGIQNKLVTEGDAQLYFYPTGEKDSAIIIFATDDEMAYLIVEPFKQVIERNYIPYDSEITE